MELIQIGEKTYYIKNRTNIGIYKINETDVFIIDSGNDKDAGKKILKIIEEQNWKLKGIINTHSNADHIGGNNILQEKTNCQIFASKIENYFIETPSLESSFLYGGYPFKNLQNKFLLAKESKVTNTLNNLPDGLEYFNLKGHFFNMIGIKTSDNIYFLADALFNEETIHKYHIFFIYDVKEYLNTLNFLKTLNGKLYIPSHCELTDNIQSLIKINENKIEEIQNKIYNYCKTPKTFEEILKLIFDDYKLVMNENQYVLIGSTIKSYLSYMYEENKITFNFTNNKMYWEQI